MQYRVEHGPAFAWLRVNLAPGERVQAEAGSMVLRSPALTMTTRLNAGRRTGIFRAIWAFFVALCRKVFGGETMFINEFSGEQGGEVIFAPALAGHIQHRRLSGGVHLFVQQGSYLASAGDIDCRLRFGGLRTFF